MGKFMPIVAFLLLFSMAQGDSNPSQDLVALDTENADDGSADIEKRSATFMKNIGYLFRGYNIIEGNPMDPTKFDDGFRSPIFAASYEQERKTADQRYNVPDNADIIQKTACSDSVSVSTIMTESEYQYDLLTKASASASGQIKVVKASFTASAEYKRMSKELKSNTNSIIKNEASCVVYEARLQTGIPPKTTEHFQASVKKMFADKDYGEFLHTFGTHFVEVVDMGARYTRLDKMSKKKQENLQQNGVNLKTASEASIVGLGSVSTGYEVGVSNKDTEKYTESIEDTKVVTIGSKLPEDGKKDSWIKESIENPMPIYYRLRSITDLFNGGYFKLESVDVKAVGKELTEFLKTYCKVLKQSKFPDAECEGPPKSCGGGSQCSANAICIDDAGSADKDHLYKCQCKQGFKGNGKVCERELLGIPAKELQHTDNLYDYGIWGGMDTCDKGSFASSFSIKVDERQFAGDDTAANAICISCKLDEQRCSKKGLWGEWSMPHECPKGSYLTGWRQNVEANKGWGLLADDTALNNVEYECRDLETWEKTGTLKGEGQDWGDWSMYVRCPEGQFICGINTRVAPHYHDDTALTDIKHQCCKPRFSKKKMKQLMAKMLTKRSDNKLNMKKASK